MNNNKGFANFLIIIFGAILVFLALGVLVGNKQVKKTVIDSSTVSEIENSPVEDQSPVENNIPESTSTCGIYVSSLEEDALVSSPIKIEGNTDGCGWNAFEAVVGNAKLFDLETNTQVGNVAILNATTEWMTTDPIYFEGEINYTDDPEEKSGYVLIEHQQVADEDPYLTYVVPVRY